MTDGGRRRVAAGAPPGPLQAEECAVEFFMFDEEKSVDDQPVIVRTGDLEHEFKVEIGFLELEVVAYIGDLKIVGYAHFGHGGRTIVAAFVRPSAPLQRSQADAVAGEHLPQAHRRADRDRALRA